MQKLIKHKSDYQPLIDHLAQRLGVGDVLLLEGDLGVGKTYFAGLLIRRLLNDERLQVPSPTFALLNIYEGAPPIYHYDLYRLRDPNELWELGLEEAYGRGITIIEWPEILADTSFLPQKAYRMQMREVPQDLSQEGGAGARQVNLDGL